MEPWLWILLAAVGASIVIEVAFRLELRRRRRAYYQPRSEQDLFIVPHPFIPYVYRAGSVIRRHELAYPLHGGNFESRAVRINNIRHLGDDVTLEKAPSMTRVMCLGGSTTAQSVWVVGSGTEHSYPLWLRRVLHERAPGEFEVLNCGIGGWTSAEIFVNFALHLIDLRPDMVVLYHGFNDLEASLTRPFASDYSHSRRSFGEAYARVRLASYLPIPRGWWSLTYVKGRLIGFGNVRHDILNSIRVRQPDLDSPFMGHATEFRNLEHIVTLCRAHRIDVIVATFAYHLYPAVAASPVHLKYQEGVRTENLMIRRLAAEHDLPLVDIAGTIPDLDEYFCDTIHFTPQGMRFVAESFTPVVMGVAAARRQDAS